MMLILIINTAAAQIHNMPQRLKAVHMLVLDKDPTELALEPL